LRIASGTKINSRRCENIGGSAIFGVTLEGHLNNGPICASVLREICDLQEMLVRHGDYESRIVSRDDLALVRIGKRNRCGSENKRCNEKSHGEPPHGPQITSIYVSATEIDAAKCPWDVKLEVVPFVSRFANHSGVNLRG
jgi:hypothetical protein